MKTFLFLSVLCCLVAGCGERHDHPATDQRTSGSGSVYGRGTKDDLQRARESATDTRPRGGSMQGAGGAGPGYDGSPQGVGEDGTVPAPGSGIGAGLTNSAAATNSGAAPADPVPR